MQNGFLQRGGIWVLAQIALFLAIVGLGIRYRSEWNYPAPLVGGLLFLAIAAAYGAAGAVALGRNLTPFPKPGAKARFVERGIYGISRHPLYVAVFCAATGWSLIRESWPALAVSVLLAVFLDAKARREERWLRQQFPEYASYAERVRRFLPGIY
ncbi:MAG TPA: isoprenylcysteine carboxylmethyltransferase family protein [Verrucomicrobiae bacterium]